MTKRFTKVSVIVLLVAACLLVAFGGSEKARGGGEISAALLSDQKLGDKGPVDLFHSGFKRGEKELGIKAKFLQIQHMGEFEAQIRAMAEDGYQLIFVTFDTMADAAARVAKDFPKTHFVILDGIVNQPLPNILSTLFKEQEASYLAGVVAGKMTKTNKAGFIGGADIDIINRFLAGFIQGMEKVNPAAKVEVTYTNNFEDPAKAKELALLLNSKGCDVLMSAAAKSTLGTYDAIKQTNQFIIGAEFDAALVDPQRGLTSVYEAFDTLVYKVMKDEKDGAFKGGLKVYGMDEKMVDLTPINKKIVPDEVSKLVEKIRGEIISGQI
ncbi:MAG: BMP family ABC transporter substrate-binding protein, partial [Deltaproteobacteria bacterium]|nr:BMP family ABC transporter substrate-binding protein [Deltaproteobacteria bacterium]